MRPIVRLPRDVNMEVNIRFPRPVKRFPREDIVRKKDFPPLYKLELKPKDKYPELYAELQDLKDKFIKKGRKTGIHCFKSRDNHISSLEVCICRCKKKCDQLSIRNLVAPSEGPAEFMDDFIKFQRLVNIIYGTVRDKDIQPK